MTRKSQAAAQPLRSAIPDLIPVSEPNLCGKEKQYVLDCIESGWISSKGKYISRFEREFADFVSARHAIAVGNGTCAIHLALLALDIGEGDEVVVPSLTYIATANAVRYTRATPVFVDSEMDSWNMDPTKIEKAITPRTKAIVPVHLYGQVCEMDTIMKIAARRGISVVEDAAEAFGSRYGDQFAGTIGSVGTYSFFGNKTMTTGEGGMVVTNDHALADKVRLLKGQGVSPKRPYYFEVVGYNYRMTNIQAAIGIAQLENANRFIENKRWIAEKYNAHFRGMRDLQLPSETKNTFNTYWMYSLVLGEGASIDRDGLMKHLEKRGVETRPFFIPCHQLPPYEGKHAPLPVAETLGARGLNLPSSTKLTEDEINYIAGCVKEVVG